jgi:serine protease Do
MKKLVWILAFFTGAAFSLIFVSSFSEAQRTSSTPANSPSALPTLKAGDPLSAEAFVQLAKVVNPAVVNISTKTMPKNFNQRHRDPMLEMLERFYGFRGMPQQPTPQVSLGTGFLIREDGLIVTNNHVIAGADKIEVQLSDNDEKLYEASVVGLDERTDLALIRIKGKGFPTLALGSSAETQVGEWVAAFGNPYGQGHTMTKGIVSAKGRDISEINRFPLIQTDAPINPGNSGGPLVNLRGQVIGVNAAIDPRAQNIGFAIPIDEVKTIIPQLEKTGKVEVGYLGVELADLDPQSANALGLKDTEGAFVARVDQNSPAGKAGLQGYDVVVEFAGKKIKSSSELRNVVANTAIGSKAEMKVMREGRMKTLSVTIGERPQSMAAGILGQRSQRERNKATGDQAPFELGFKLANMTDSLRKEFNHADDVKKPVIVELELNSIAARAGLLVGDAIADVNRREVETASEALKNLRKGVNLLKVVRPGPRPAILFITIEAK